MYQAPNLCCFVAFPVTATAPTHATGLGFGLGEGRSPPRTPTEAVLSSEVGRTGDVGLCCCAQSPSLPDGRTNVFAAVALTE
jgi:hypothetical protein